MAVRGAARLRPGSRSPRRRRQPDVLGSSPTSLFATRSSSTSAPGTVASRSPSRRRAGSSSASIASPTRSTRRAAAPTRPASPTSSSSSPTRMRSSTPISCPQPPRARHRASLHVRCARRRVPHARCRAGGALAIVGFHVDQWRETGRPSRFAYDEIRMRQVLETHGFAVEHLEVEREVETFASVEEALAARHRARGALEVRRAMVSLHQVPRGRRTDADAEPPDREGAPAVTLVALALTAAVKARARELGFDRVAIGPADAAATRRRRSTRWLDAGHAATMSYLARGRDDRARSRAALARRAQRGGGRAQLQAERRTIRAGDGVARYARGRDYHDVMRARLLTLRRVHH